MVVGEISQLRNLIIIGGGPGATLPLSVVHSSGSPLR